MVALTPSAIRRFSSAEIKALARGFSSFLMNFFVVLTWKRNNCLLRQRGRRISYFFSGPRRRKIDAEAHLIEFFIPLDFWEERRIIEKLFFTSRQSQHRLSAFHSLRVLNEPNEKKEKFRHYRERKLFCVETNWAQRIVVGERKSKDFVWLIKAAAIPAFCLFLVSQLPSRFYCFTHLAQSVLGSDVMMADKQKVSGKCSRGVHTSGKEIFATIKLSKFSYSVNVLVSRDSFTGAVLDNHRVR